MSAIACKCATISSIASLLKMGPVGAGDAVGTMLVGVGGAAVNVGTGVAGVNVGCGLSAFINSQSVNPNIRPPLVGVLVGRSKPQNALANGAK
jgi:hypothetical protein